MKLLSQRGLGALQRSSLALCIATLASACAQMGIGGTRSEGTGAPAATSDTTARPAGSATAGKVGPGMNAQGQVVDSKVVEAGYGQKVKGMNDWEGEITGKPGPGSKFTQLQIGMGIRQVTDLAGAPTDQGAYITGKAFIPFFYGSGRSRHEMVYKGMGRLIFESGSGFDFGSGNLVWIIHNPNEGGYR